ncbi:hypothetical protein [Aurantiacibacter sediminis]|uniref:DUF2007 domain-containing protein n=1 Tax=Aurantiacibacter sediminis TaxID=2793064 RepID=A0ABS0N0E8_9SPHN|nr:hypothetical protein [Aurantiacibacter sediminis]MBH5321408.1 hypothetical protein [Aurantiacibacter sediminis]
MGRKPSDLAHVATITSRPHALVIASALEHEGIPVWIDGVWHASADPLSNALGGHRLTIPVADHAAASSLIREMGLPDAEIASEGQTRATQLLVALFLGPTLFFGIPAVIAGLLAPASLLVVLIGIPTALPVDPRGQNDFFLTEDGV